MSGYICTSSFRTLKRILFTVTNDLLYDQRMQRIASTLTANGYSVLLVGRRMKDSKPLMQHPFQQHRLSCWFHKGFLFYLEFQVRLFFFLMRQKADCIGAIDLDTILPCYLVSTLKKQHRMYDAHELFTEQIELVRRPFVQRIWLSIERWAVPKFTRGYTVNAFIAAELAKRYGVQYAVIRNLPIYQPPLHLPPATEPYFLYQGSVNHGRCFETLIPAMKLVPAKLVICGKGNFFDEALALAQMHGLTEKIEFKGYVTPDRLKAITANAYAGITLFESAGLNQYQSLANRFFDYMMGGIPQICVDYPEYHTINQTFEFALPIPDTSSETIAQALNKLLTDAVLYERLKANALVASTQLNWEMEASQLLAFYKWL